MKNRNINVDVTDHCLVSNLRKNEITGIWKMSIWSFVISCDSLWLFARGLWLFATGFRSFVVVFGGLWSLAVLETTRYVRQIYIWEVDTRHQSS